MCEQCEAEPPPCCPEHLFVERSQYFVHGEFLYWTVEEGTLDYAIRMNKSTSSFQSFGIGDYKTADYDWRPGYRIAVSYYRCPKYWEATAQYTWLYDRGSDSATKPEETDRYLNPTRTTQSFGVFETAKSLIDLHYHVGDLNAARVFDPNPHLRLRVLGGLTAAYIEQSWKMRYTDNLGESERVKEKWRFWGGGFRMGVAADWYLGCQFYLTGRTTFAALIGTYKNEEIQTQGASKLLLSDATYDDHRFSVHGQFLLGPSWQIPCDCWSFELFAGYEFNVWFNLQERIRTLLDTPMSSKETLYANGLLGLHGLTLRLTLGF